MALRKEHPVSPWLAGFLALALAAPAPAQQEGAPQPQAEPFIERVDVELVTVDVWVSDRRGNAVTGLGAGDFQVSHDGESVAITHFTEVRGGAAAPSGDEGEAAAEVEERFPSHVVVYFDQSRLHPSNYQPLIQGLTEFLATDGIEPERVLILRQDASLFVEAPFGSSRSELEAALKRLAKGTASGADLKAEADLALDAIRSSWEQNQDLAASGAAGIASAPSSLPGGNAPGAPAGGPRAAVGGPGSGSGSGPDACGSFIGQIEPILSSWARSRGQRAAVTLSNLADTASFLAGLPGVKTLLYLSDGLDTQPGAALASYAASLCPAGSTELLSRVRFDDISSRFLDLTRHANTNRVTVYAIQGTGLTASEGASASSGRRARGGGARSRSGFEATKRNADRQGLELIAAETGGRTVVNRNEFGPELRKIAEESRTYYSLAYQPPEVGEGRDHRIEVRLRDESMIARYRRGYVEKDSTRWLTERIEGALNLGLADNPLEVRLGGGAVVAGVEGSYRMPLLVMIPAERLTFLPRQGATVAEVIVRVMARSIDSSSLVTFDKTFQVKGAPGATGFAQLAIELELAAGAHVTAVGVQDTASGEASFISTTLQFGPEG